MKKIPFNKVSRELVGFSNLGDINCHLFNFQSSLEEHSQEQLAKTMLVFTVWGLSSSLEFPYIQLPTKQQLPVTCSLTHLHVGVSSRIVFSSITCIFQIGSCYVFTSIDFQPAIGLSALRQSMLPIRFSDQMVQK